MTNEKRVIQPNAFDLLDLAVARIEIGSKSFKALAAAGCSMVAIGFPVGVVVAGSLSGERHPQQAPKQNDAAASVVSSCVEYTPSNPDC